MIKRTLYFGNPSYLSLKNAQMVLRLPEVEANDTVCEKLKKDFLYYSKQRIEVCSTCTPGCELLSNLYLCTIANNWLFVLCSKSVGCRDFRKLKNACLLMECLAVAGLFLWLRGRDAVCGGMEKKAKSGGVGPAWLWCL